MKLNVVRSSMNCWMLAQSNRVILTMRADFWGECARYSALKDRMLACQELVAPMTVSELRAR